MTHPTPFNAALKATCELYGLEANDIMGPRRERRFAWPRQNMMLALVRESGMSYSEIGRRLGDRDHTTVKHAERAASSRETSEPKTRSEIAFIAEAVRLTTVAPTYIPRSILMPVFKSYRSGARAL